MSYSDDFGFDVVEYIKKLRNVGVSQEIAEVQGQEFSHMVKKLANEVKTEVKVELHSDNLATKADIKTTKAEIRESELRLQKEIEIVRKELEIKIANTKNELVKWILGVGVTASIVICSAMFTMLKLLIH